MGRAISALSGSAAALLPRPFALLKPALMAFWHEMTRDIGRPLPARAPLHARPRPEMARQARPAPGPDTPLSFQLTGSKLAPLGTFRVRKQKQIWSLCVWFGQPSSTTIRTSP